MKNGYSPNLRRSLVGSSTAFRKAVKHKSDRRLKRMTLTDFISLKNINSIDEIEQSVAEAVQLKCSLFKVISSGMEM